MDIDEKNLEYARRNIESSYLSSKITLLPRKPEDSPIPDPEKPITFYMMNSPFYSCQEE